MPNRDKTGPLGTGPVGRGRGGCKSEEEQQGRGRGCCGGPRGPRQAPAEKA